MERLDHFSGPAVPQPAGSRSAGGSSARRGRLARLAGPACVIVALLAGCAQQSAQTPPSPAPQSSAPPPVETTPGPSPTLEIPQSGPLVGGTQPVRVALLVPLTGRAEQVGGALRNAAEMALFDVSDERFVLSIHDTASTPDGAIAAADAALSAGARLIIGPLFGQSAAQVGPRAQAAGVPVLSFSNNRSVAGNGVWVFGLLPADQIDRVVGYAAAGGMSRFGALLPANAYGEEVRRALFDSLARVGATGPRVVNYAPGSGTTELAATVERFAAGGPLDAVVVPEGGAAIRNIAPMLAYNDIDQDTTRYLGSALWADPSLGQENTLVGAWFAAPSPEIRKSFEGRYTRLYGSKPPGLASLAYDAVSMAAELGKGSGPATYNAEVLTQPSGFVGADGLFRLLPDGTNERRLAVLRITPTGFEIEDPAPQTFQGLTN